MAVRPPAQERSADATAAFPSPVPLILVVDDFPDAREVLSVQLRLAGFLTAEAASGLEAVEKALTLQPALVLLDYAMPGMDGFATIERLRADPRTRTIPIIVVTAYGLGELEERVRQAGADSFLVKPVNPHELLVEVRRVLGAGSGDRKP